MLKQILFFLAVATGVLTDSSYEYEKESFEQKKPTKFVVIKKPLTTFNAAEKVCKAHGLYFAHITGKVLLKAASAAFQKACVKEAFIGSFSTHPAYKTNTASDSEEILNEKKYCKGAAAYVLKNVKASPCGELKPIVVEIPSYKAWKKQLKYPILCQTTKPKFLHPLVIKKKLIKEIQPPKSQYAAKKYLELEEDAQEKNKFHVKAMEKVVKHNVEGKKPYNKNVKYTLTSYTSYETDSFSD